MKCNYNFIHGKVTQIFFIKGGKKKGKKHQPHYRPEVPRGFQEVKVLRLHDNGPGWW